MIIINRVQNGWILCLDGDLVSHGPQYVYNKAEDLLKDLKVAMTEPPYADHHPKEGEGTP
jgi:hypothetical protein